MPQLDAPTIEEMGLTVRAALDEFTYGIALHEAWRPAAFDESLHDRMGNSYAANTFDVIRVALRRELLLTLSRLWDSQANAINLVRFEPWLRDDGFIDKLISHRKGKSRNPAIQETFRSELTDRARMAADLIAKFKKGGDKHRHLDRLQSVRGRVLGHHQLKHGKAGPPNVEEKDIEQVYQGTSEIIAKLMGVLNATAVDPLQAAGVHAHYATFFWASVRGERTEGHPDYRQRPQP